MFARDRQTVLVKEGGDRLIILNAGSKGFGELIRREETMKIGAVRIVNLLEQVRERLRVPHREADHEVQHLDSLSRPSGASAAASGRVWPLITCLSAASR